MAETDTVAVREAWLPIASGAALYYRDYGSESGGVPLVCLHGYWRTSRDFEELAAHYSGTRRVITVDLRGRGKSARFSAAGNYHFDHLVEDVVNLLDAEGISRAAFIGVTLGAQIAMDIAIKTPSRVAAIILDDTGAEANLASGNKMKSFADGDAIDYDEALRRVKAQYADAFPRFGETEFARLVYRNYARTEDGLYVRDFDPLTNHDLARMMKERPTAWNEFRAIRDIPFTLLHGANSDFLTAATVERMRAEIGNLTVHTIPDCGHPVMLWEPDAFAAIDEAIADVEAVQS